MTPSATVQAAWLIEEAIAQLRAGDRLEACALLTKAVRINPKSAQAWLWLAATVETVAQRRLCLEHVVALEPDHPLAVRALAELPAVPGLSLVCASQSELTSKGRTAGLPVGASGSALQLRPAVAWSATGAVVEPPRKRWNIWELSDLLQISLQRAPQVA